MTCNCKGELEVKLAEHFVENNPEATKVKADLGGYGITLGAAPGLRGYMECRITGEVPRKTGGTKPLTKRMNMFFSYCPFCGKSIVDETKEVGL